MAKPTTADRLLHNLEAIATIETATSGMAPQTFAANRFVRFGVERCLEIISEASRHIPDDLKSQHGHVPWRRVADIGNRIRHACHAIDNQIIWEVIQNQLGELKLVVQAMQNDLPA